jgi:hypothetical protein
VSTLFLLLLFVALAWAGPRWGADSRTPHDARDDFWWPNK